MDIIYLTGAAAEAAMQRMDAQGAELRAWLTDRGAKSFEAVIVDDPPTSDVDVD